MEHALEDDLVSELRIIVCGGREYDDAERVYSILDKVLEKFGPQIVIITGAQRKWVASENRFVGADFHAEEWARSREIEYQGFPARWKALRKRAGYERNTRMRVRSGANKCIAFPGGSGTRMMCGIMLEAGIEPWCIDWEYSPKPVTLNLSSTNA